MCHYLRMKLQITTLSWFTSGNELNNGISKIGNNYRYNYDSDQFQIEYWYRYVIYCVLYQYWKLQHYHDLPMEVY